MVFGADIWASDCAQMSPEQELYFILSRLERTGRGSWCLFTTPSADGPDASGLPAGDQTAGLYGRARNFGPKPRPGEVKTPLFYRIEEK